MTATGCAEKFIESEIVHATRDSDETLSNTSALDFCHWFICGTIN